MSTTRYSEVIANLRGAGMPVREIGAAGKVAVTPAAGRVIAMAFGADSPNLFWSHPNLGKSARLDENPGGFGGDRLWFAPEPHYSWKGPPDYHNFSTYETPAAMDPGQYEFVASDADSVVLHGLIELQVLGSDRRVAFEISRAVRLVESPVPSSDPLMSEVDYVGIETVHELKISPQTAHGLVDLWHLLQVPAGAVLIVPFKRGTGSEERKALAYGLPGSWVERADHLMWRYGGTAHAKIGLSAAALTGRTAVFKEVSQGQWCMLVREFSVAPRGRYCDYPYGKPRNDQAFQAWDGFGFGEMEFHSPAADAENGPRELREADRLWAFGGAPRAIAALGSRLLGIDVVHVCEPHEVCS